MSNSNVLKLNKAILNTLPEHFSFSGTLDLTGSLISELPEGLFVQEDLILNDCKITKIPANSIIGGDLYLTIGPTYNHQTNSYECSSIAIDPSVIIGGQVYINGAPAYRLESNKENFITLDSGSKFFYKTKVHFKHNDYHQPEYNRTPFDVYYGYSTRFVAVKWTTENGVTYAKTCKDRKEARFLVNYQDALDRGIEKYKNYDIKAYRTVEELKEIFIVSTRPCSHGVSDFLTVLNIDANKLYTIEELGTMLQLYAKNHIVAALDVFLTFFNIPIIEKETN